jgi:hypothetical protein
MLTTGKPMTGYQLLAQKLLHPLFSKKMLERHYTMFHF